MRTVTTFSSLYIATLFMLFGSGLLTTYLALALAERGASDVIVSSMTTAYYAGMVIGAKLGHHLIAKVGHIRSYVAASGVTAAIVLLIGLIDYVPFWAAGRFIIGLVMMCQYMVLESWLNEQAEPHQRGLVFGLYMAATYLGMMLGQLVFLIYTDINSDILMIVAICFSLCLVPLAVTRALHPTPMKAAPLEIAFFLKKMPQVLLITAIGGMMSGSFYGLAPIFANRLGLTTHETGIFMAVSIGAALFAQWPLAWLSDNFNRLKLVTIISGLIVITITLLIITRSSFGVWVIPILLLSILITGLQFTIYPLTVAIANDNIDEERRVSLSAIILVVYGLGSAIGPLISASISDRFSGLYGPAALYLFPLLAGGSIILLNLFKATQRLQRTPEEASPHIIMSDLTSPISAALDPRIDDEIAKEQMANRPAEEIREAIQEEIERTKAEKAKSKVERNALIPIEEVCTYATFICRYGKKSDEEECSKLRYH